MYYQLLLTLSFLLFSLPGSYAQTATKQSVADAAFPVYGVPDIIHYQRKDFNADPQFWAVCEDPTGVLYFGNNDGALIFDGQRWQKVALPNNSSVRSLVTDESGRVWAGGYNELGQIRKDESGRYYYSSLLDSLQLQGKNLENLWQVHALKGTVIYRSFRKLLAISGNKVVEIPATSSFLRSYQVHDQLFVLDKEQGLFLLDIASMQFSSLLPSGSLNGEYIVALLPLGANSNQLMAIAQTGKVFLLDRQSKSLRLLNNLFPEGANDQVISAIRANDGLYYLGTLSSRILAMNEQGRVYADEHNFQRVQDKTILNLYQTSRGNLWALLNNGLDYIDFSSPVTTLFENASIYDAVIQHDKMYLATNQGIFLSRLVKNEINVSRLSFEKIKGLEGQAWSLQQLEGDVLVGHDRGLFQLQDDHYSQIGNLEGIWKVIPVQGKPGHYLACSYNGLYMLRKGAQGKWEVLQRIEGFDESSRDILASDTPGTYWVCHGYKGVFRIKLDADAGRVRAVEHFTTSNGLPSAFSINVFRWEEQVVFTTNQGIYSFNAKRNQFEPFAPLNTVLDPGLNTRKLLQYEDKTWFVQDDEAGFFYTNQPGVPLQKELFLGFKGTFNRSMEFILPLDGQRVLLGTTLGLYLVHYSRSEANTRVPTLLSSVRYTLNQETYWLPLASNKAALKLPHNTSSLRFEFAAPGMPSNANVQYSYRLDHVDEQWSAWSSAASLEYNHLRPGRYAFRVKSRSLLGTQGEEAMYPFEILPIWYTTPWAWALYGVLAVLFMVLLAYLISRKMAYENNKTRLEEHKARKLLELELEQMKLQNEKERIRQEKEELEEDVIYKSKELANYTMLLVKKREVFSELLQDLKNMRELAKNDTSRLQLREIIKKISHHLSDEEYLQVFDTNFETVHHKFFSRLRELFPDLNQRELRLCAFVKMNLANKEISPLLNISVRGVETGRYRLRKKLNLEHEHNLVEFLEKLSPAEDSPEEVE